MDLINYSSYALEAFTDIQNLNDEVQLYIDGLIEYNSDHNDNIDGDHLHEIKSHMINSIDDLSDVLIEYINHIRLFYREYDSETKFQFSNTAKDYVYSALNIADCEYNIPCISQITTNILMKYISVKYIHENILEQLSSIMPIDEYSINDKQICYNEKIVNIIDYIVSIFYDCTKSIDDMCDNEDEILNMIKSYIIELRIITIIIEFLESIESL